MFAANYVCLSVSRMHLYTRESKDGLKRLTRAAISHEKSVCPGIPTRTILILPRAMGMTPVILMGAGGIATHQ